MCTVMYIYIYISREKIYYPFMFLAFLYTTSLLVHDFFFLLLVLGLSLGIRARVELMPPSVNMF